MEAALHVAAGVCVEMPRVLRHPKRGFQSLTRDLKAMFRFTSGWRDINVPHDSRIALK